VKAAPWRFGVCFPVRQKQFVTGAVVNVWTGVKVGGTDPVGTYTRVSGCDPAGTFRVEA
jgi:hypothetical protein